MADMQESDSLWVFFDRLADAARRAILPYFRVPIVVEAKEGKHFDPVTAADREAETAMRALIGEYYPHHGILGEEFDPVSLDADYVWVLDPIDGTRAFIAGLPVWGTLIGLLYRGTPIAGMMVQPFTGERFFGDGKEAFHTGPLGRRKLATRSCSHLAEATLFTTSPRIFTPAEQQLYDSLETSVRLARYGCDCYAYAMLAAGFVDLVVEAGLKTVDIVALIPIIEGAGGKVTSWNGGPAAAGGQIIACGDVRLYEKACAFLRPPPLYFSE